MMSAEKEEIMEGRVLYSLVIHFVSWDIPTSVHKCITGRFLFDLMFIITIKCILIITTQDNMQ